MRRGSHYDCPAFYFKRLQENAMGDKQLQFNQGKAEPPEPAAGSTTPAGQPAAPVQAAGAPANQEPPSPFTKEQMEYLAERERRNRQSVGDQVTNRVQQEIARLEKAGITVTPAQAQKLVE